MAIHRISVEIARPLRTAILRPDWEDRQLCFPGDEAPDAAHFGVFLRGDIVGVVSILQDAPPELRNPRAWRLRGMALEASVRRKGYGRALIEACIGHAKVMGGDFIWCNARTYAVPFYESVGFQAVGEEFELSGIGPHYRMVYELTSPARTSDEEKASL